MATIFF